MTSQSKPFASTTPKCPYCGRTLPGGTYQPQTAAERMSQGSVVDWVKSVQEAQETAEAYGEYGPKGEGGGWGVPTELPSDWLWAKWMSEWNAWFEEWNKAIAAGMGAIPGEGKTFRQWLADWQEPQEAETPEE